MVHGKKRINVSAVPRTEYRLWPTLWSSVLCQDLLMVMAALRRWRCSWISTPPTWWGGVFTPYNFLHPQHRPPLGALSVLTPLVGCMLFSAHLGGYCSSLNFYSSVYYEFFVWIPGRPTSPYESATDRNYVRVIILCKCVIQLYDNKSYLIDFECWPSKTLLAPPPNSISWKIHWQCGRVVAERYEIV